MRFLIIKKWVENGLNNPLATSRHGKGAKTRP